MYSSFLIRPSHLAEIAKRISGSNMIDDLSNLSKHKIYAFSGSMDAVGLHIAFHGCKQGKEFIGDVYARHTGLNNWAEANKIIILYPQIKSSLPSNGNGCFDWWGYLDQNYHTKKGTQMTAIAKMVQAISGYLFD